jgi:hypothetical protein
MAWCKTPQSPAPLPPTTHKVIPPKGVQVCNGARGYRNLIPVFQPDSVRCCVVDFALQSRWHQLLRPWRQQNLVCPCTDVTAVSWD